MCSGCLSYQSRDLNARPFGDTSYGSLGDKGVAIKASLRYEGDNGQDKKFEGIAPGKTASAAEAEETGRQ